MKLILRGFLVSKVSIFLEMTFDDKHLIENLLSAGVGRGVADVYLIYRGGSVLMALPRDKQLALKVVGLYQPQKLKAKLLKSGLKWMVRFGIHRCLKKQQIPRGEASVLAELSILESQFGFILSNAHSENRNMMLLYSDGNDHRVMKAGIGASRDIIAEEFASSERFSGLVKQVLKPSGFVHNENFAGYTTAYIVGNSPSTEVDQAAAFAVVESWLDASKVAKISESGLFQKLSNRLGSDDADVIGLMDRVGDYEVKLPIGHGDFTPWNIIIDERDEMFILDWEYAETEFVPGWDIFHYIVQKQTLVDGKSSGEVLELCREWISSERGLAYFEKARLAEIGQAEDLLGTYLLYSQYIMGIDRAELISIWRENHG